MEHAAAAGHPQPRRSWVPMIAALVVVLTIVWAALQLLRGRHGAPHSAPVASEPSPERASPPPSPERLAQPQAGTGAAVAVAPASMPHEPAAVLHEEMPVIAKSATDTIHGHFDVTVHVTVNSAGNVVDERLEDAGPSKYFARRATEAAQKWKFAPGEPHSSREWLLRFEFSRDGTAAHAEAAAPPPLP